MMDYEVMKSYVEKIIWMFEFGTEEDVEDEEFVDMISPDIVFTRHNATTQEYDVTKGKEIYLNWTRSFMRLSSRPSGEVKEWLFGSDVVVVFLVITARSDTWMPAGSNICDDSLTSYELMIKFAFKDGVIIQQENCVKDTYDFLVKYRDLVVMCDEHEVTEKYLRRLNLIPEMKSFD